MKILIYIHRFTGGGAERVAALWATGFSNLGHEVIMVGLDVEPESVSYHTDSRVRKILIGFDKSEHRGKRITKRLASLRRVLKTENPDFAIGLMTSNSFELWLASLFLKIPIVNTEHNSFERPADAPFNLKDKVEKFILTKLFKANTLLTEADKRCLPSWQRNIYVLYNPLALTPVDEFPSKSKTIIAVGRIDAWHYKGFDLLIDAWSKVASRFPDWRLKIVGAGNNTSLEFLKNKAREGEVEKQFEICSFSKNIDEAYRDANIFVLSSRYEGFGLVLIEAMSQGCACIACDYNGRQRELVEDKKDALVCNAGDVETMANDIALLISNDELRNRIQKNAIVRSHYFDITHVMDRWDNILKESIHISIKG